MVLVSNWYQSCENCGEIYMGSSNPRFCGACARAKRAAVGAAEPVVTTTNTVNGTVYRQCTCGKMVPDGGYCMH